MVATGAQVRLFRRGAARPVGVRWAAPIACAGSVQAVAQRKVSNATSLVSSKKGEKARTRTTTHGGTTPQGGTGTQGQNPPQGEAASAHRRGPQHRRSGGGQPGGHNTQHRRGHQPAHKGAAPNRQHLGCSVAYYIACYNAI